MRNLWLVVASFVLFISSNLFASVLPECELSNYQKEDSRIEHIYGGVPDDSKLYERRAFVLSYNEKMLVPRWVSWHASKHYMDTPDRKYRWKAFRVDMELDDVKDDSYDGWYDDEKNYVRGHLVPYYISGGDRDNDGLDAEFEQNLLVEDMYDACTVFEVNSMSNIAPQFHKRFNGAPGVWWALEAIVRNMLDDGIEFNIFAGTIFVEKYPVDKIGPKHKSERYRKIGVPHGFFKLIINTDREEAVAFLFDHSLDLENGCDIDDIRWPTECIVTVEKIEELTGLKFFQALNSDKSHRLRKSSSIETWKSWVD